MPTTMQYLIAREQEDDDALPQGVATARNNLLSTLAMIATVQINARKFKYEQVAIRQDSDLRELGYCLDGVAAVPVPEEDK